MLTKTTNEEIKPTALEIVEIALSSLKAQKKCKTRAEAHEIGLAPINKITPKKGVPDNFDELIEKYK